MMTECNTMNDDESNLFTKANEDFALCCDCDVTKHGYSVGSLDEIFYISEYDAAVQRHAGKMAHNDLKHYGCLRAHVHMSVYKPASHTSWMEFYVKEYNRLSLLPFNDEQKTANPYKTGANDAHEHQPCSPGSHGWMLGTTDATEYVDGYSQAKGERS